MIKQIVCIALCVGICIATPCLEQKKKALEKTNGGPLIGAFVPQCEEDGSFTLKQCHASTGYCFCVNEDGVKITEPSRKRQSCKCKKERYDVTRINLIGAFVPKCKADGTYESMQCHASTGACWCVTEEGQRVDVDSKQNPKSCGCNVKKHLAKTSNLFGAFVPKCEADGSYSSRQCHENYCWCSNTLGQKLTESSTGEVNCQCPIERSNAGGLLGAYRPMCDKDGSYSVMQCHENYCWCAGRDGKILKGMKPVNANQLKLETCTCYRQEDEILKTGLAISLPDCS